MADSPTITPSSPTARERLSGMTIDDEARIPEQEDEEEEDLYSSHPLPPPRKPASKTAPIFANWKRKQLSPAPPSSSAVNLSFIGRKCGADWKTSGSAEKLLEEVARTWKRNEGAAAILVDGSEALKAVIRDLEVEGPSANKSSLLTRGESFDFAGASGMNAASLGGDDEEGSSQQLQSAQMVISSKTGPNLEDINPRDYIQVVDAFTQPKYKYNQSRKQFERFVSAYLSILFSSFNFMDPGIS
ncbi:DNA-directed DNA polymerase epsilon, subunit B [Orbilia oligospora]|uniref:DNA-directed DNA polymerase epsilon, subunit B n=1 Tax=Orbilia oligospora TaxID=2813651 RepID=A0A7C8V0J0_ORBOL|nr:DNA-directed DNA polymerase epsilon, subunit B [Orbilia oligospora]